MDKQIIKYSSRKSIHVNFEIQTITLFYFFKFCNC